jgi:hypothetical protein
MRSTLILAGTLFAFSLAFAAPAPDAKFDVVDLKDKYNHKLSERFHNTEGDDNVLPIDKGKKKLGDVEFKIADGVIQLGSTMVPDDPEKVEGIKVGQKFVKLHILHACGYGGGTNVEGTSGHVPDDTTIGEYKVLYDDKTTATIPIVYGQDVRDWWYLEGEKETSRAKVVWKGENEQAKKLKCGVRLYMTTWKNPKPDKKVVSIDYIGRKNDTPAAPFCVAITAESE